MTDTKDFYTFQYSSSEGDSITMSVSPGDSWPEVLEQFVSFMNSVYGYDIRKKVGIRADRLTASMLNETWSGAVFNPEDEL